jgi:hypothetical protein
LWRRLRVSMLLICSFSCQLQAILVIVLTRSHKLNLIRISEATLENSSTHQPTKKRNLFKDGLTYMQAHYPAIKAVFLGTRECDPYSGMTLFNLLILILTVFPSRYLELLCF